MSFTALLTRLSLVGLVFWSLPSPPVSALPPPDEVPEEILRTEIILEARSPLTGEPLSAADYALLQEDLANLNRPEQTHSDLARLIFLLQVRRALRSILPVIP